MEQVPRTSSNAQPRRLPNSRVSRELQQETCACRAGPACCVLPFPEGTLVPHRHSPLPFPVREPEDRQSQVRGLSLNCQHPDVTPASRFEMKLTEALKAEAVTDGSEGKLTSPRPLCLPTPTVPDTPWGRDLTLRVSGSPVHLRLRRDLWSVCSKW